MSKSQQFNISFLSTFRFGPLEILAQALDYTVSATTNLAKYHPESSNRVWMGVAVGLAIVLAVAMTAVKS
jgi:hypothetical protein